MKKPTGDMSCTEESPVVLEEVYTVAARVTIAKSLYPALKDMITSTNNEGVK